MPPISSNVNNNPTDKPPESVLAAYTEPAIQKFGALQLDNNEESQVDKFMRKKNSNVDLNIKLKGKDSS